MPFLVLEEGKGGEVECEREEEDDDLCCEGLWVREGMYNEELLFLMKLGDLEGEWAEVEGDLFCVELLVKLLFLLCVVLGTEC